MRWIARGRRVGDDRSAALGQPLVVLIAMALVGVHAGVKASQLPAEAVPSPPAATDSQRTKLGLGATHFVYLYPTDRPPREDYRQAIIWAQLSLRQWFADQLGGPSFTPSIPEVQLVPLANPAAFYRSHPGSDSAYLTYWQNVINEALPATGARFYDPGNAWIFYVDAPAGCGQLSGGAAAGIAVVSDFDLRGLVGDLYIDPCTGQPDLFLTFTPQRWIGGQGHELGHAWGLPHPPGCDDGLPSCDYDALMWAGFYGGFPDRTYLRSGERLALLRGTYIRPASEGWLFSGDFEG